MSEETTPEVETIETVFTPEDTLGVPVVLVETPASASSRSGHDVLDELKAKLYAYGAEVEASVRHLVDELRGML